MSLHATRLTWGVRCNFPAPEVDAEFLVPYAINTVLQLLPSFKLVHVTQAAAVFEAIQFIRQPHSLMLPVSRIWHGDV